MTSWLRKYYNIILRSVVVITVIALGSSHSSNKSCKSPLAVTCEECVHRGPQCSWCYQKCYMWTEDGKCAKVQCPQENQDQENRVVCNLCGPILKSFLDGADVSERCDSASRLLLNGCGKDFIEDPQVKVEANTMPSSSQVNPRDVSILLRPGSEVSFLVEVQQLDQYPVDLYYLVDVSASMQDNLDKLKTVGMALSQRMKEHSSDFRVGFGSFVDKPVSPYIDVHPSKIINPCSDYEVNCRPAHGFIHVLPITDNMTEFRRVIQQQKISGNMDTPEGGFDAMLQAAVCQDIGWRPEAKHLLLVMTDQPSHLALDSKLAGIVVPHDGRCHLVGNTYSQSANMEHPTIGQLAEKLLENSIHSIFAVDQMQYKWYEDLVGFLPAAYLGKLLPKASNLTNLVVEAYKKLLSDVGVEVGIEDREAHRFWVNITAVCPSGSTVTGNAKCSNVQPSQKVLFNITMGMRACPSQRRAGEGAAEVTAVVRAVGFNETVRVRVQQGCGCSCGGAGPCHNEPEPPSCTTVVDGCRQDAGGDVCSGRGACVCGTCVCDRSNLGTIYGKYCERDDFSCPYNRGLVCGGHGQCVSGSCWCQPGWTGESCGCPTVSDGCVSPDGLVCSGLGECVCGECVCNDPRRSGTFCEKCPTCSNSCQSQWSCVDCHMSSGAGPVQECNSSCPAQVAFVDDLTDLIRGKYCLYQSREQCFFRYHVDFGSQGPHLRISKHAECLSTRRYFQTFLSVFLLTVVLGLGILAVVRLLLRGGGWPWSGRVSQQLDDNGKDYAPTTSEKTITYKRDHLPENLMEMHVHVPKMPLNDAWP